MSWIILSCIILTLLYAARKPRPAKDAEGASFNSFINDNKTVTNTAKLNKGPKDTIVVASYNVQTGKSLEGKRDIKRSANVIQHVDIAGIQEVYALSWLNKLGIGTNQTNALASPGKFTWLFCPTRLRWLKENRGNAVLSKLPIKSWQIKMLPDQTNNSFRNMTVICFEWQQQNCYFINTHLHTGNGRLKQLETVLNEFDKYSPAILVGDFNSKPDTQILIDYLNNSDSIDSIKAASINHTDNERIDWILTKGWKTESGRILEKGISDHPYYEVTLSLNQTC